MRFIDKIKWRLDFLKKIIQENRFQISDCFYFFCPKSKLKNKKRKEEIESLFDEVKKITGSRLKKINSYYYLFELNGYQIITPSSERLALYKNILDFGISILRGEKINSISDYDKKIILWEREGPYELEGCFLKEGDVVIDAGANMGIFSLLASKRVGESGKIFAFEPVEKIRSVCEKNLEINGTDNIKVFKAALGDEKKKIDIFVTGDKLESSSIIRSSKASEKEVVGQIKLDDFVEQNNIQRVDFIKVDIEGAERNMLVGAEKTIKKFKPRIAICTYHLPDDPEVIESILKEYVPEYKIVKKYKKIYTWI